MKSISVLVLVYLPVASRSTHRVREFRRCEEHGNLLCYEGRALSPKEFNEVAPKLLGDTARTQYGMQPMVKLIEVEMAVDLGDPEPEGAGKPPVLVPEPPKPEPVVSLVECGVEAIADGFMLVDYSSDETRYMGTARAWENDAALVSPFATEAEARKACQGVLVDKPVSLAPGDDETTSDEAGVEEAAEDEAAAAETPDSPVGEAETPPTVGAAAEASANPNPAPMQPPAAAKAAAAKKSAKAAKKAAKEEAP